MTQPSANGSFSGALLGQKVSSFTIATIKLKASSAGSGAVTVSNVILKNGAATAGSSGGAASYTIEKAPDLPGAVKVSSSSHPDSNAAYEATTIVLSWDKASGVDNFSYLLDQAEKTTPPAKATDANTSATFADKAVGTYYFHIRAHKPDGWGGTTHFKINIKEPDAKIDQSLSKPNNITIVKSDSFVNTIKDGTVTGLKISGKTEPGFTANFTLTPTPNLPEGKVMSATADTSGNFELILDFPIAAGFHKLSIQGQNAKVLTPISDEITFEISQKEGGAINILTDADISQPAKQEVKAAEDNAKQGIKDKLIHNKSTIFLGIIGLFIVLLAVIGFIYYRRRNGLEKVMIQIVKKQHK
jgi:hypothetical protein